jgi:hypothetical protein
LFNKRRGIGGELGTGLPSPPGYGSPPIEGRRRAQ